MGKRNDMTTSNHMMSESQLPRDQFSKNQDQQAMSGDILPQHSNKSLPYGSEKQPNFMIQKSVN